MPAKCRVPDKDIVEAYLNNPTWSALRTGVELGVSESVVLRRLRSAGVDAKAANRRGALTEEEIEDIRQMHECGVTAEEIGRRIGRAGSTIVYQLRLKSINAKRRRLNERMEGKAEWQCEKCLTRKPLDMFKKDRSSSVCKKCVSIHYVQPGYLRNKTKMLSGNRRDKLRIQTIINEYKCVPCMDCGKLYPSVAMDLDHIRGEKFRAVSEMAARHMNHDKVRAELLKCDPVCSNCHRIRTFSRTPERTPTNKQTANRRIGRDFIRAQKSKYPCADCKQSLPHEVLDFDHLPGTEKKYTVSKMANLSKKTILAEISKCEVVCSNCHRVRSQNRGQSDWREFAKMNPANDNSNETAENEERKVGAG